MTIKRTSFRRHNIKKSLKSAANLIFAIEGFTEFFESVQTFCRSRRAPVGTGLGLGKAIGYDDLPFGAALGDADLECRGNGL